MIARPTLFACFLLVGGAALPARAQSASLPSARQAYANVDYEETLRLARETVEQGGNDRDATADLHLLWGTAAAALGRDEEARGAFTVALAMDPELKLEQQLSPKIRGPYLEARGNLAAAGGRAPLGLEARLRGDGVELVLTDALRVAARVEVATRDDRATVFRRQRYEQAPRRRLPITGGSRELFLFARVLDRYDNILFELGSELDPQRFTPRRLTRLEAPIGAQRDASATPYHVTAATLGLLGVAAGGIATAMYLRREDAAQEWNGSSCERPGMARGEQCGAVDDRRQRAENMAIGFTAAGGALLLGGLVSLLIVPEGSKAPKPLVSIAPGRYSFQLTSTH